MEEVLASVAAELYGLDPESFTAARNARAREASAAGDRTLADAIKKLGKPTAAAWLANRLARSDAAAIDELIGLGPALRTAQGRGERTEMRRLVERRRALIGALVKGASVSAREGGHSFGPSVERQLAETLEATVADEAMAVVLKEGRLSEPFRFVGFGDGPSVDSEPSRSPPGRKTGPAGKATAATRAGKVTAEAVAEAKATAEAEAARQEETERRAAREAVDEREAAVEKAQARLAAADERLARASKLMGEAEAEKTAANEGLRAARQNLGPARRRLKRLGEG
jgi:hypothetical protein